MDIVNLVNSLSKVATIKKNSKDVYEVFTDARIGSKSPLKFYLINDKGKFKFADKQFTLKYMNSLYELKAPDVKSCISSVVKIYGFTIASGELFASINSESEILEVYYNYIVCIGQLINMYAFFDKP